MNTRKFHLPGEAALLIVLLINPLAIDLMSKSVFGISTISSVPLILSTAFPVFSFGTWNYIFQTLHLFPRHYHFFSSDGKILHDFQ